MHSSLPLAILAGKPALIDLILSNGRLKVVLKASIGNSNVCKLTVTTPGSSLFKIDMYLAGLHDRFCW